MENDRIVEETVSAENRPMEDVQRCRFEGCVQPAAAALLNRCFCREHFITYCHEQLEAHKKRIKERPFDEETVELLREFLPECTLQATQLAEVEREADPQERTRLLDIILHAANLSRCLRRSPRRKISVPVWLRREGPGQMWEEETRTLMVSRHGAGLECRHLVETGGTIVLARRDTGQRAVARVKYSRYNSEGLREIGVEFLDADNFWQIDPSPSSS